MAAIKVWVYKDQSLGDCSNNGATNRYDRIIIFSEDTKNTEVYDYIERNIEPQDKCFRVETIWRGQPNEYKRAVPVFKNGKCWMAGGCFGYTSDSRFTDVTGGLHYPISIHDRTEDMDDYLLND